MVFKDRLGDRRGELRFEIIGQLWGSLEVYERLPLRNLGRGGALVESLLPLSTDTVHGVRLVLDQRTSELQARVRHVRALREASGEKYLVGLEFVSVPPATLEQIDRIVAGASSDASIQEANS